MDGRGWDWVEERTALLAPRSDWVPNVRVARAKLETRVRARAQVYRGFLIGAMATIVVCVGIMALPRITVQAAPWTHIPLPMYRLGQAWTWLTVVHSPLRLKLDRVQKRAAGIGSAGGGDRWNGGCRARRICSWPVLGPANRASQGNRIRLPNMRRSSRFWARRQSIRW